MTTYRPEGLLIDTPENCAYLKSISALEEAMREGRCLEGREMCIRDRGNTATG